MNDQPELTVPKDRQEVAVFLKKGARVAGIIFLDHLVAEMPFHQKISAFLEDGSSFFPLAVGGGNTVEFINKKTVQRIEVDHPKSDEELEAVLLNVMVVVNITAFFLDGSTVRGGLLADVPQDKARLSDCLNLPDTFLCIQSGEQFVYINKDAVQKVVYEGQGDDSTKARSRTPKHRRAVKGK